MMRSSATLTSMLSLAVLCAPAAPPLRAQPQGSSPTAYLTFDDGTGTVATDASGTHRR